MPSSYEATPMPAHQRTADDQDTVGIGPGSVHDAADRAGTACEPLVQRCDIRRSRARPTKQPVPHGLHMAVSPDPPRRW